MIAHIITIGDEILIGQIVDTNSSWIAAQLQLQGIQVGKMLSIADQSEAIIAALDQSFAEADLLIMTGGLGPTKDDITKQTLARYFQTQLVRNPIVLEHVKGIFARSNRPMLAINEQQADVLKDAEVLFNAQGTAPGMWIHLGEKHLVILPGVPFEMKHLMQVHVLPRVQKMPGTIPLWHHTFMTAGLGESYLAERIAPIEDALPSYMHLAYLPQPGAVRLRLSAQGHDVSRLQQETIQIGNQIKEAIGEHFIADQDCTLPEALLSQLQHAGKKWILAESCTGGYLAHLITQIPGSSAVFEGSLVTYSNLLKERVLGVDPTVLRDQGAVSEAAVQQMALGALELSDADYAIAVSGIAGPTGAVEGKSVGTVWIAVAGKNGRMESRLHQFGTDRMVNIQRASQAALFMLWQRLHVDLFHI
jgi:nicotinamide-nucleotide amidase